MKRKNIFLTFLAVSLVLTGTIGSAWAYFTTYVEAQGSYTLSLGDETTVEEGFSAWIKKLVVQIKPDSEPVYVRAKAFGGEAYPLTYGYGYDGNDGGGNEFNPLPFAGSKWVLEEDGYCYYKDYLYYDDKKYDDREEQLYVDNGDPGKTQVLKVKINDVPEDVTEKEFNVVVIYETAPVQYKDDGTAYTYDAVDEEGNKIIWDNKVDIGEGGAE